ncbi:MAG: acyl-CoA dehydrogenase family protein [Gloeomargarita sp. SKYBB_i_bin120]|nr:acyl-CoA/acyl-ACP dehydrogenase [Gloeomargarita sp. SKYG98]MCS7292418.1 acyl-CoA/acyl-ACP dehydrogenase [Gloeomargarita sp. SKYB120]MDW8177979.1 acyl-CoA dehydrogenase family protein [Gloeomargarita sp. SKYBB_i_bin120]
MVASVALGNAQFLSGATLISHLKAAVKEKLQPMTEAIDRLGLYPKDFLRYIGALGAYAQAVDSDFGGTGQGLLGTLQVIETVARECGSTGFLTWCQNACAWYMQNSDNLFLKHTVLPAVARGEFLAGTGLSNPMKHFAGIEKINLIAQPCQGGYVLNGMLPWVSNIGDGHYFAIAARLANSGNYLMAIVKGGEPGLVLRNDAHFIALEGTGTFKCIFRDYFVSSEWILSAPCTQYVELIKPGFILSQVGIGLGIVASCIELIRQQNRRKSHVNCFLDDQAESLEKELDELRRNSHHLAEVIGCGQKFLSKETLKEVIICRIKASELALRAAQSAMLHAGAIAYLENSPYYRKLREAYFVAIVTPALKHLRKMLASLE